AIPINHKFGFRFSGNRSSTGLMFRFNGRFSEFTKHPGGTDGNFSLNYEYSKTGRIKLFGFASKTEIGVKVDQPSFDGIFVSNESNQLYNLQWSELLDKSWLVQASFSINRYRTNRNLGILDLNQRDQTYKLRIDSEKEVGPKLQANIGAEVELTRNGFVAVFPDGDVLDPNAPSISIDEHYDANRTGAYLEAELQLTRGFFLKSGIRADRHDLAHELVLDPRASLFYRLSSTSTLRASWGIYHQFAEPLLYAPIYGNPNLQSQKAAHYIVGYEKQLLYGQARVELYYKDYNRLVIENEKLEFANTGHGYARGLDLFFKQGVLFQDKLNGWISYSFLQSRRLQTRDTRSGQVEELAPSSFDVTHNLTLVGKYTIGNRWSAGLTFRYATGRPFTPVVEAERDAQFNFYTPFEGPVNSERLPDYHRLDANLSYFWPFENDYVILYLALSNVLNRKNVLNYDYSIDYSERSPRTTNFSRFVYFGATFTFR
ncbi:TonB-dependent receptor, partial [bacterium]|nr:TonB-dependent receptor [bacterium]